MPSSYCPDPASPSVLLGAECALTSSERLVYLAMIEVADPRTMLAEISVAKLVDLTGLTKATVTRARKGLIEKKAIDLIAENRGRRDGTYGTRPNLYGLVGGHISEMHDPILCLACSEAYPELATAWLEGTNTDGSCR